jgi:hypothetical protein
MVLQAWREVEQQSIANCWRHVNILPPEWQADIRNADERVKV